MKTSYKFWMVAAALLLPLGSIPAQERVNPKESKAPARATVEEPTASKAATDDPAYVIGAEDQLSISVWKEPDITRLVPVRPDGKISLPLINDVQAAGLTPMQLAMSVSEKLKKFISDPQVTVIVTGINSRRYYIVGEMNRAGAFPLLPNMTVLQALSSAGGFTQFANMKGIYVLRIENGKSVKLPFNYKEVIKGSRPEQNIILKPGDTIVVP
ncbi:MAG: polysaccharide biosynthesis/export family protein [Acidobacteria bacterium]|nr:polysaccharide biosynthesis/export family protein [Acidobacteriota bacterium]MBI3661937.1 polysaccharide biosynthesis/export family protein [Acidobacteriota bacterium]